ncbi:MAG: AmmeMemoRadiSam system radical SAM enzyme [Bacillota bacterium]
MREALFYKKRKDNTVVCRLCPKACVIKQDRAGYCRVRENREGVLYTLNYGRCTSCSVDPMEKKPLYHFYPAHTILSLGTFGCNLHCSFCQNWEIAHGSPPAVSLEPERVAAMVGAQGPRCTGVAYTYSEPMVWYEFVRDTARLVSEAGYKNVLVTNGMVNEKPLKEILPYIDALNIDVKAFRDDFYKKTCAGRLQPVKKTVAWAREKCHVEVTTLIVTGLNDSEQELGELVEWLSGLDPDMPLHLSRYFPNFEMDRPPTPPDTLRRALRIARERLNYVYLGNIQGEGAGDTLCPACGTVVISRTGYTARNRAFEDGKCAVCGNHIPIKGTVWREK